MKKLILVLIPYVAFAGTEPINTNTANGHVKESGTGTGSISKPIDFTDVRVTGLSGSGFGTVTSFSAGDLSPIFTTNVSNSTTTPVLSFTASNVAAHSYLGNNTGSLTTPAYHVIDYSELSGTPGTFTPSALTKTDDTNVTLTLGGTPATALLEATSLTLGWTGTLAISRGGFGKAMTDPNADRLIAWDDTDGDFQFVTVGTGLTYTHATHTLAASAQAQTHTVTFVCDGSGSVLTTGTKAYIKIPFGGTLTGWTLIGSPSGSITIDIFRATDTNGLPVTSIVGGGGTKPALSTAVENKSTSFSGWTSTTLNAFDNMAISLSGITSTTYVALILYYQ